MVFFSDAGNLTEGEPDEETAVFVHDISSGMTQRMRNYEEGFEDKLNR